jgi:hypothetical protein
MSTKLVSAPRPMRHLARLAFVSLLLTFIASRTLVILIMTRHFPDLFMHMGGTHVHHLNYGIFLLSVVAGVLLFTEIDPKQRGWCAVIYGIAMALTFDEFGMWLHLGGSYWQRASFDAVVVVLTLLGLLAFLPARQRLGRRHYIWSAIVLIAAASFYVLLFKSLNHANDKLLPRLLKIEQSGPT